MDKKGDGRTVAALSVATFLNDMGSDMIYPIWPLFVLSLGADMALLGLIDGLGNAIVSVSQAISGYVSDKIRRRKIFIWSGYLFGGLSRIGYAFSTTWQHLIPFRILDRAGKMRGAPRDAMIAEVSTTANRGRNFGLLRTMDNLGAVCGIIICILLFSRLGYVKLLLLAAVPSFIGVLLLIMAIKERRTKKIYKGFSFKHLDRNFKLFLFLSCAFAFGSFSYSFLLVYANEFGFQTTFVPVLYLIFTTTAFLTALPFGKLADLISRKFVLILSYLFFALVCVGFIFLKSSIGILFLFVLYGLHRGAIEPAQRTFVSELSPQKYRATGIGTYQMLVGLCALPASVVAGLLWVNVSVFAPFYLSLALTTFSGFLMFFVKERK